MEKKNPIPTAEKAGSFATQAMNPSLACTTNKEPTTDDRDGMPRPAFSFRYGGRVVAGNESMQVDDRLKVTLESAGHPEYNATEWVLWFENPSSEKSAVLSDIRDGDFLVSLPPAPKKFLGDIAVPGDRAVVSMNGCVSGIDYATSDAVSAREFAASTHYFHPLRDKVHEIGNDSARSSENQAPFFEVTQDGQGAIVAIGWSGGWHVRFEDGDEGVRVAAGMAHARFYLEPGEKLRTSRILVMNYGPGEDAGNKFRRLLRNRFSHVASRPGIREGVFAYELWGGITSDEMIHRLKTLKEKGLAYEDLWIDAGWYGNSKKCDDAYTGDWGDWTGDWIPNARIHPDGLENVRDAAKDAGMGIMLWFEPEHVVDSTRFAREHPDLLAGPLLHYGNERAREIVRDMLADYAERLEFSCYRQDFNFDPSDALKAHDAKDREGISEIRHITGLYRLWDELLARFPKMLIDNCASGGRRIDIETLRRSVPFFRSDYQCGFNINADVLQAHNAGISRLLPYNGCTVKLSDAYSLRSAYSSSHGVAYWNTAFQKEEAVDWPAAKKCCDEYRRIRKYFPCDFYNHGSAGMDPAAWAIWQYHDPELNEGVVLAFRRAASPSSQAGMTLKGLPEGASVEVENLDSGAIARTTGDLEILLPERRSSTVLLYCVKAHR
ncbi:MAG: alpha-galactosidase [Kiritimatiellia bacterium]|jgi:alpha-galactosidase